MYQTLVNTLLSIATSMWASNKQKRRFSNQTMVTVEPPNININKKRTQNSMKPEATFLIT
jgi:hypothetical protein